MADLTHRIAKSPVIPEDGTYPYWTTVCGKRLQEEALAVTSNTKDVTCLTCGGYKAKPKAKR